MIIDQFKRIFKDLIRHEGIATEASDKCIHLISNMCIITVLCIFGVKYACIPHFTVSGIKRRFDSCNIRIYTQLISKIYTYRSFDYYVTDVL